MDNLIGIKINRLTVLAEEPFNRLKCKCDCGKEKSILKYHVKNSKIKSCGCLAVERNIKINKKRALPGNEAAKRNLLHNIKKLCKRDNKEWGLNPEEYYSLIQMNCFYCNSEPDKKAFNKSGEGDPFIHLGLDRIDNNKGYIQSNIVPCCSICNFSKRTMSFNDFCNHIEKTYNNLQKKGLIIEGERGTTFGEQIGLQASILILAFNRPNETKLLLESIKRYIKFDKFEVILYVNGGDSDPFWKFYEDGLCDTLVVSKINDGSGIGTIGLIKACRTNLFIYLQNDNFFIRDMTQEHLNWLNGIKKDPRVGAVDLTGLVPKQHKFSERAFVSWRNFYLSNKTLGIGGTGPYSDIEGSEPCFARHLENTKKIVVPFHGFIGDSGMYSEVELPCGGILQRRCDSQELRIKKIPKQKIPIFNLNNEEWDIILRNEWTDWRIPELSKDWVFLYFSDKFENEENRKFLKR